MQVLISLRNPNHNSSEDVSIRSHWGLIQVPLSVRDIPQLVGSYTDVGVIVSKSVSWQTKCTTDVKFVRFCISETGLLWAEPVQRPVGDWWPRPHSSRYAQKSSGTVSQLGHHLIVCSSWDCFLPSHQDKRLETRLETNHQTKPSAHLRFIDSCSVLFVWYNHQLFSVTLSLADWHQSVC